MGNRGGGGRPLIERRLYSKEERPEMPRVIDDQDAAAAAPLRSSREVVVVDPILSGTARAGAICDEHRQHILAASSTLKEPKKEKEEI